MENKTLEFIQLSKLLTTQQLSEIDLLLAQAEYIDGKQTASMAAKETKNNLQINLQQQNILQPLQYILLQAFNQSELFQQAVLPKNIYAPLFSAYEPGMHYGWHVDSPVMGYPPVRTDVAMTIFLEHPEAYEGGELEIQGPTGTTLFKLAKGDAVCYPCQYVHQVREVTKGKRKVAVTWIQSMVKESDQRNMLSQLKKIYHSLYTKDPKSAEANELLQTYSNLLRMWAEI